jgi:hypothetical protein
VGGGGILPVTIFSRYLRKPCFVQSQDQECFAIRNLCQRNPSLPTRAILFSEGVLEAAGHTNTMMWIGRMEDCPIDLSSQVRL